MLFASLGLNDIVSEPSRTEIANCNMPIACSSLSCYLGCLLGCLYLGLDLFFAHGWHKAQEILSGWVKACHTAVWGIAVCIPMADCRMIRY